MNIVIPTRGRVGRQTTLASLGKELRKFVTLVCPEKEVERHKFYHPDVSVVPQVDDKSTIAQKRKWIMWSWASVGDPRMIMMDDDLRFCVKRDDKPELLRLPTSGEPAKWLGELWERLTPQVPHGSLLARAGSQSKPPGWKRAGRAMYVLAYHVPTVLANAEIGRIETREDMDVTLQLLRKGLPMSVCCTFVSDQREGHGDKGGCTGERTIERSNRDAHRLAELHPGYVRVVSKSYKNSEPRDEVVCSWEKALRDGELGRDAA